MTRPDVDRPAVEAGRCGALTHDCAASVARPAELPLEIDLRALCRLNSTALQLPDDLPFDRWRALGADLQSLERSVTWWLGDWWAFGEFHYGERCAQDLAGRSLGGLANAGWVSRRFETSRRREVLSWSHHAEVAALAPEDADRLLDQAIAGSWSTRDVRRAAIEFKRAAVTDPGAFPPGKFRVVYADPPWQYNDTRAGLAGFVSSAAETHYPTMTKEALCALAVGDLAGSDCVLFCWATFPLFRDCIEVVSAWGFEYKTAFVWDKERGTFGHYHKAEAELLLVCTRGSATPELHERYPQVVRWPRAEHSRKPEQARAMIDELYPSGPRIELFRRGQAPDGWTVWGNQASRGGDGTA